MPKLTQIHRRINGWKIGDYCYILGPNNVYVAVGQLTSICRNNWGTFVGFIITTNDPTIYKLYDTREWGHYLHVTNASVYHPDAEHIERYEAMLLKAQGQI